MVIVTHEMGFAREVATGFVYGWGRIVEKYPEEIFQISKCRTKEFLSRCYKFKGITEMRY